MEPRGERLRRGAKLWATLWALAALSVLIPGAHFVLVPGFFVAGPIAGWLRTRQTRGVLGGEGACPARRRAGVDCGARRRVAALRSLRGLPPSAADEAALAREEVAASPAVGASAAAAGATQDANAAHPQA